ncbi:MAG: high-potential iron-sulfur protein [Gammaproteobacteria bacterium]|nr:high-potential iron-sulfur protein [Gammaproteobacteria bacterium]
MIDEKISRRQLLQGALAGLAAVPAVTLIAHSANAAESLSEDDATAKSLAYVGDAGKVDPKTNPTYKPGQHCANCIQYTGQAGAADGPCNIFPGKTVKAKGWCKVWVLKPGEELG